MRAEYTPRDIERFWSKVDRSGGPDACWMWTAARHEFGYGKIRVQRKDVGAHRVAWEITNGPVPEGMFVCHTCDNPPCCNPAHLWIGTSTENAADRHAKGRSYGGDRHWQRVHPELRLRGSHHWSHQHPSRVARGEAHGRAHLTADNVRAIRQRYAMGATLKGLAQDYGVTSQNIWNVVHRKTWAHVD